ncbi:DUF4190 domain-containing protein [Isoptericola sp. NPDC057653]|uniref:DUF4190 domain-containing protein n=1 Tax=Isoptericola sp. NPDC057653 TaxID=3346195 RepID=UPI0036A304E6
MSQTLPPTPGVPVPPAPFAPAPQRGNAMAITGFVVALVALVLCFVPIINNFAFFLALVGLVFGIIGLVRTRKGANHKGLAIAAVILAVLSGGGVLVSQSIYSNALDSLSDDLEATTSSDQDGPTKSDEVASEAEEADDVSTDADAGSRENPYAFGQEVSNADWTVKLGKAHEATDEVLAANMFNEQPGQGMEYWIVPVTATYTGDETGLPMMDISVEFVGDDARTYSGTCVAPDALTEVNELYAGGKAKGNVCVEVPKGAEGTWTLTAGLFNDPVFFTTEK